MLSIAQAIAAGKMVMSRMAAGRRYCSNQTADIAERDREDRSLDADRPSSPDGAFDPLCARPRGAGLCREGARHGRSLASGIAWTTVSDSAAHLYVPCAKNASLLSVSVNARASTRLQFVVGDLDRCPSATSAVRQSAVRLADTNRISSPRRRIISRSPPCWKAGPSRSIFYRGGTSRGDNFRWEINGSDGDLVLTSPLGNLQVLAPNLFGGRGEDTAVAPLDIPPEYDLGTGSPKGLPPMSPRLYAAFAAICGMAHRADGTGFRACSAPSQDARRDRARSR